MKGKLTSGIVFLSVSGGTLNRKLLHAVLFKNSHVVHLILNLNYPRQNIFKGPVFMFLFKNAFIQAGFEDSSFLPPLFQHTFSSLLKQKPPKTSPTKSRGSMAVSMREVDPVFQGAGQKEYPSVSSLLLVTISILIPASRFVPRMACAIIFLISVVLLFQISSPCCHGF